MGQGVGWRGEEWVVEGVDGDPLFPYVNFVRA